MCSFIPRSHVHIVFISMPMVDTAWKTSLNQTMKFSRIIGTGQLSIGTEDSLGQVELKSWTVIKEYPGKPMYQV